jgi:hypothetical protein
MIKIRWANGSARVLSVLVLERIAAFVPAV